MQKLEEICEILTCGVAKRPEYFNEGIPFLSSKNVKENRFVLNHYNYISKSDYEQLTKYNKPRKGDILYTRVGSFGEAAVVDFDFDFAIFVSLTLIRPKDNIADSKFLMYYLNSPNIRNLANSSTSGIGVQNLNVSEVRKFPINLPPLPTQQKIANILDKADELRQYNKQLIEKYESLTQSLFLDMFGDPVHNSKKWIEVKFSEVGKLDRGKSKHRPRNAPELLNGPYPLVQTGDVANSGGYIENYKSSYSEFGLKQSKLWPKGTLCITIAANIAKTGILTFDACFPDSVVGFVPNKETNNIYVQNWMSFLQAMIEEKAPMAAQKNINLAILKDLEFMKPPIELQNQFAERVATIETQKQQAQEALAKSEVLFQGLLQQAFNGELS